jgi:hypothetical protein
MTFMSVWIAGLVASGRGRSIFLRRRAARFWCVMFRVAPYEMRPSHCSSFHQTRPKIILRYNSET